VSKSTDPHLIPQKTIKALSFTKILKLVDNATGNSGIKRFNATSESMSKTKTSRIDSNIITKEKLLAEAERT